MTSSVEPEEHVPGAVLAGRYAGVHVGVVSDNADPDGQGRVQVHLPWSPDPSGGRYEVWARLATMMAGADRGTWFVPDVDDEVLVAFVGGDPAWPVVVGSLWNGQDQPPETMQRDNPVKAVVSRRGVRISLDDTPSATALDLTTPAGQHIQLTDGGNKVLVEDAAGNSIELGPGGITVTASGPLKITAPNASVDAGSLSISCPLTTFSGVVQVDTLLATSVVSSAYTPGVGNIW